MAKLTNGVTGISKDYVNADFDDGGHDDDFTGITGNTNPRFEQAMEDVVKHAETIFQGRSSTSLTIGSGPHAVTMTTPNRPYFDGSWVRIEDAANSSNFIEGPISSVDAAAGTFTLAEEITGGSGTVSDWKVFGLGKRGEKGDTGSISNASASQIENDSTVPGVNVDDALEGLDSSKADTGHTHTLSDITDSGSQAASDQTISTSSPSGGNDGDVWYQV